MLQAKSSRIKHKKISGKMSSRVERSIQVLAGLLTIITAIIVIFTAIEVKEFIVRTQPDLRIASFDPMVVETGESNSFGWENDSWVLSYHHEENIQSFEIWIDIVNIGPGVAYDLDVKLGLPGLKYSLMTENQGGVRLYKGGTQTTTWFSWTDSFHFSISSLSPQGGNETLRLTAPFEAIGSIENLPRSCIITVKDITKTTLLEKTITLSYIQS